MALILASFPCAPASAMSSAREMCTARGTYLCRKAAESLRESTDTGYWCDACKHLKRDFRKAGHFCLQITGLWSSEFSSFSQGDPKFQSSICILKSLITLFHVFILQHIRCRSLAYQNATEFLQFACFPSPRYKCHVTCKTESSLTAFSFLIPRSASSQQIRDHWGATKTTAYPMLRDKLMQTSHSQQPHFPWWIFPLVAHPNPAFPPETLQ